MAMPPSERVFGNGASDYRCPRCSLRQVSVNDDLHNTVEQLPLFR